MSSDPGKLKELFLRLEPCSDYERRKILNDEFGDDQQLRGEVLSLLDAADETGDRTLDPTMDYSRSLSPLNRNSTPEEIGPYRILSTLGEGGMAKVFKAVQEIPVHRFVALKIAKRSSNSDDILRRFAGERRAHSRLSHPNIATIYDAGGETNGHSWFAMELVEGPMFMEYCDQEQLDIPTKLQLFEQICRGVQHAHTRGIIHRDLKPSNLMVKVEDGKPVPKIIDFGVAKALGRDAPITEQPYTLSTQLIGTLEFMSPEQAQFGNPSVDARTDIYALGVILYRLLSGEMPLDRKRFEGRSIKEIQHDIETVVPRPMKLNRDRGLSDDLNCVVLKCLEKDPDDRYETAQELANDVSRILRFEPIVARPLTNGYILKKFIKRNRISFALGSIIAASVVLGLFGTTIGFVKAAQSSKQLARTTESLRNTVFQLEKKEAALIDAVDGLENKSNQLELADKASREMIDRFRDMILEVHPQRLGRNAKLRDSIVGGTKKLLVDFKQERNEAVDGKGRFAATLIDALYFIGDYENCEKLATMALEFAGLESDPQEFLSALYRRAHAKLKQTKLDDALVDFEELIRRSGLHKDNSKIKRVGRLSRLSAAEILGRQGKAEESLQLKIDLVESLQGNDQMTVHDRTRTWVLIALGYSDLGQHDLAREYLDKAYKQRTQKFGENDHYRSTLDHYKGLFAVRERRFEVAAEALTKAVPKFVAELGPASVNSLHNKVLLLYAQCKIGRVTQEEAAQKIKSIEESSLNTAETPLKLYVQAYLGMTELAVGQKEKAIGRFDKLLIDVAKRKGKASDMELSVALMITREYIDQRLWELAAKTLDNYENHRLIKNTDSPQAKSYHRLMAKIPAETIDRID